MTEVGHRGAVVPGDTAASASTPTITVVLVDDHLLLAEALAATLGGHEGITVPAVATTCADGVAAVRRHQPTVCLLDQRLPDGRGTELLAELRSVSPTTKVLLVTADDSVEVLRQAVRGGAVGVIGKGQRGAELRSAVLRAAAGETVYSPEDLHRLLPLEGRAGRRVGDDLTTREREVLRLLVGAVATPDIADRLSISRATARNHIQAVLTKLGAHSRLEAVTVAVREGIVSGP